MNNYPYDFTIEDINADKDSDFVGNCEGCGCELYEGDDCEIDIHGDRYCPNCNTAKCIFCGRTFRRSEALLGQSDEICSQCALDLGHLEV